MLKSDIPPLWPLAGERSNLEKLRLWILQKELFLNMIAWSM